MEFSWVERFYTHFLARDISKLFSGGLFICIVEYAFWGKIDLPTGFSLESIGFLIISYLVGMAFSSLIIRLKISGKFEIPEDYENNRLLFEEDLLKTYNERVINHYERYIYLMIVARTVGLSSLFGGFLMIVIILSRNIFKPEHLSTEYYLLMFSSLIYGIYMIFDARKKTQYINKLNKELGIGIKK